MRVSHVVRCGLLLAVFCVIGCASKNKGKIEGTKWSSQSAVVKGQSLPAGALKLEFRSDGSLVYQAGPVTYTGRYSLGMGDYVTLKLDQDLAGRKSHSEKVVIS